MRVEQQGQAGYRQAYQAWQDQLGTLHRVFLKGEAMAPPKLKGLRNREAHAKERYDTARLAPLVSPSSRAPIRSQV